jgi:hypothetical protein
MGVSPVAEFIPRIYSFHHAHRLYGQYLRVNAYSAMQNFAKLHGLTQLMEMAETHDRLEDEPIWAIIFEKLGTPTRNFSFK